MNNSKITVAPIKITINAKILKTLDYDKYHNTFCVNLKIKSNEKILIFDRWSSWQIEYGDSNVVLTDLPSRTFAEAEIKRMYANIKTVFPNTTLTISHDNETVDLYGTTVNI